jgi:hypothetical protein
MSAGIKSRLSERQSAATLRHMQRTVLAGVTSIPRPSRRDVAQRLKDRALSIILFDFKVVRNAADTRRTQRRRQAGAIPLAADKAKRVCISTASRCGQRQGARFAVGLRT